VSRIGLWGVLGTAALVIVGGLIAFVWIPHTKRDPNESLFAAWCSAWGVPRAWLTYAPVAPQPTSEVVLDHQLLGEPTALDVGHGATLALRCTMCHGPTGISYANSPNLAGQYATVVYKQLRDYKSGIRSNAIMTPMAHTLSDTDMRQLAFYYASLPRPQTAHLPQAAPAIVKWGAPMRNIAPCGSCHGDVDHTQASPWLGGEPESYIRTELLAFASGERTNDINAQMRDMAQGLTQSEIEEAAAYYAGAHP
jgi:cytochrome c553